VATPPSHFLFSPLPSFSTDYLLRRTTQCSLGALGLTPQIFLVRTASVYIYIYISFAFWWADYFADLGSNHDDVEEMAQSSQESLVMTEDSISSMDIDLNALEKVRFFECLIQLIS